MGERLGEGEYRYREAVRRMDLERKLQVSEELRRLAWQVTSARVRAAHPTWSDAEVEQQVREVFLRGDA